MMGKRGMVGRGGMDNRGMVSGGGMNDWGVICRGNMFGGVVSWSSMYWGRMSLDWSGTVVGFSRIGHISNIARVSVGHMVFHSLDAAIRKSNMVLAGCGVSVTSLICLLYTSPSPRDRQKSRMPSSA